MVLKTDFYPISDKKIDLHKLQIVFWSKFSITVQEKSFRKAKNQIDILFLNFRLKSTQKALIHGIRFYE